MHHVVRGYFAVKSLFDFTPRGYLIVVAGECYALAALSWGSSCAVALDFNVNRGGLREAGRLGVKEWAAVRHLE